MYSLCIYTLLGKVLLKIFKMRKFDTRQSLSWKNLVAVPFRSVVRPVIKIHTDPAKTISDLKFHCQCLQIITFCEFFSSGFGILECYCVFWDMVVTDSVRIDFNYTQHSKYSQHSFLLQYQGYKKAT